MFFQSPTGGGTGFSDIQERVLWFVLKNRSNVSILKISFNCWDALSKVTGHKTIQYREYKNFEAAKFREDLLKWEESQSMNYQENDIINYWENWKCMFLKLCDKHAPIKCIRVKNRHNPWITRDIITLMYERDHILKKASQGTNNRLWDDYKQLRNRVTKEIELAKKKYFGEWMVEFKSNPKKLWKESNRAVNDKRQNNKIPPNLDANKFNTYFKNIGSQVATQCTDKGSLLWKNPKCTYTFRLKQVSVQDVLSFLKELSSESNLDVMNFDSKLLYTAADLVAPSITKMINMSIESGCIPLDWKKAKITPVYKGKGCRSEEGNYRPISVIGHIAKIMEKVVQIQLMKYLQDLDLINISQFVFLKHHSTSTCLHRVIDEWLEAIQEQEYIGVCFLDIEKCFDTIDHDILLQKLSYYGIYDKEMKWFKDYLMNRTQRVLCNGCLSKPEKIKIGVPQGSILGPILFLLYINDISQHINGTCNLYADDIAIYTTADTVDNVNSSLQECVGNAMLWYENNRLVINT